MIPQDLKRTGQALSELGTFFRLVRDQVSRYNQEVTALEQSLNLEERTLWALEQIAGLSKGSVSALIEQALKTIYGNKYRFRREGKVLYVGDDYGEHEITEKGGGISDLLSMILRVVVVAQGKAGTLKTVLSDEPLVNADTETAKRAAEFLSTLGAKLGINFVIVTHRLDLIGPADKLYWFEKVGDETRVTELPDASEAARRMAEIRH